MGVKFNTMKNCTFPDCTCPISAETRLPDCKADKAPVKTLPREKELPEDIRVTQARENETEAIMTYIHPLDD